MTLKCGRSPTSCLGSSKSGFSSRSPKSHGEALPATPSAAAGHEQSLSGQVRRLIGGFGGTGAAVLDAVARVRPVLDQSSGRASGTAVPVPPNAWGRFCIPAKAAKVIPFTASRPRGSPAGTFGSRGTRPLKGRSMKTGAYPPVPRCRGGCRRRSSVRGHVEWSVLHSDGRW